MRLRHSYRSRVRAAREAYARASQQGWTVLIIGNGYYLKVLEQFIARSGSLYSGEQVVMLQEQPALSIRLSGGGEIKFVDYTPGSERGTEAVTGTADVILIVEDEYGSMMPILKHVVHPMMGRSGEHCVLTMVGEQDGGGEHGEY